LTGVDADLMKHVRGIGPIAQQPAGCDFLASGIDRGNPIARRERRKLDTPADKERVGSNEKCIGPLAHEGREGRLDLATGAGVEQWFSAPVKHLSQRIQCWP
jgi:hypothetical protein